MKKKKNNHRKFLKISLIIGGLFFVVYLCFGMTLGWPAMSADLTQKGRVAGTAVTALVKVFGPPDAPAIEINSGCNADNHPYIYLFWPLEDDATSYNIYRNGEALMLNITDNYYTDENITDDVGYSYVVRAQGPEGSAESDPVLVNTQNCAPSIIPEISIVAFKGKNISSYHGTPSTTERRPTFSGITNIPNATIQIEVHSGPIIYGSTQANANGYWQWTPPINLEKTTHTIYVTATDPINPAIVDSMAFDFWIVGAEDDDDDEENDADSQNGTDVMEEIIGRGKNAPTVIKKDEEIEAGLGEPPFDFGVELQGKPYIRGVEISEVVYRGENLSTEVAFTQDVKQFGQAQLSYILSNEDGYYEEFYETVTNLDNLRFEKKFPFSYSAKVGKYKLEIAATIGEITVSQESYFFLEDRPIVKIGASVLTYYDIFRNIGWLVIFSIIILIIMIAREYRLAKRALFQVTEKILKRKGYMG